MFNRSYIPDKSQVTQELNRYIEFSRELDHFKEQYLEIKNKFNTSMNHLVNDLKQFDYDIPETLGELSEERVNLNQRIYRVGIFNFFTLEKDADLRNNLQCAYWLHLNEEDCDQLLSDVSKFRYLTPRLPKKALGRIRFRLLNSEKKEQYINTIQSLIEINEIIKKGGILQKIHEISFSLDDQPLDMGRWVENHFDETQEIYKQAFDVTVIEPNKLPKLANSAQLLDQIIDFNRNLKTVSDEYHLLVNDIRQLSHSIMENEMESRFNHFSIDDFLLAYPGLPSKILRENFSNLKEMSDYSNRFERVEGIGPKKSQLIQNSYDAFRARIYETPIFKIDAENISPEQQKLIQVVFSVYENQELFNQFFEFEEGLKRIPLRYKDAEKNLELLWCYFESKNSNKFEEIQLSINEMSLKATRLKDSLSGDKLILNELSEIKIKSWFQLNAATLYAIVERFGGIKKAVVPSDSGIAKEILDKIEKQEINSSKLKASLRGWQTFAVKYALVQKKVLIGDEMGLGKTIEAIGVMADLFARGKTHFLVVCPASIIINWEREIQKHSDLPVFRLHGAARDVETEVWMNQVGIGITTYETLQKLEIDKDFELTALVVDEAHYVKNPFAKRSIIVHEWAKKALYVMYMTGTPIENNVDEMIALIKTLQPKVSKNIQGKDYFLSPVKYREAVAPVYLRRKKEDVLSELPPLTQNEEWENFGQDEQIAYEQAVADGMFMRMRRCAWLGGTPEKSPKLERLLEICEGAKQNGEKVIVFSFFRDVISLLSNYLGKQTLLPITGSVSSKQRQEILDDFDNAPAGTVLLSQIVAGGIGLNIQAASIIVFCEPQIKPSLETQAIARAHRMGQTRPVFVYRLLTENSIDEQMMQMLNSKQSVFDNFAKNSYISDQSIESVDISDSFMVKNIIQKERERLKLDISQPIDIA